VSADMEFCLLGPLVVSRGGKALPVLPGKQRVLLAALLLHPNRMVSLAELTEALWGPQPPATARGTLRNYVKELRKALADDGENRLCTVPGGYRFRVTATELDAARFSELRASGVAAAGASAWAEASAQLHAALSLWRGEPLADVPSEWLAAREVPRLAELRLGAIESRIEADLHLGRHEHLIAELRRLTAAHPFRERLHGQLMLALYRDGQQAAALAAFQRVREALLSDLGVEPGSSLRLLQQQILRADPALTPGPAGGPGRGTPELSRFSAAVVPRQLPAPARYFTGRTDELKALMGALGDAGGSRQPAAVWVVTGTAGVGKTATAVHWAQQAADGFPDGQLYIDLRGYDPGEPMPATDALAGFIRALGVAGQDIPAEPAERTALYRSLLSGRRVLVLLDNACSAEQVRPLLPGTPGCATVVTSRDALPGLVARDGAERLELEVLPGADSAALLRRLIGKRATSDTVATQALAAQCSWLPLALRVAAELAAARPEASIAELVTDLADHRARLDLLGADGDARAAVRTVFSWSTRHLDVSAARAFRLLGLHPGGDFEPYVVAALTGASIEEGRRLLGVLGRAYLVQPAPGGRHRMHELLRAYAAELAASHETAPDRLAALMRLLDYYLHTAHAAVMQLNPARSPLRLSSPQPGLTLAPLAGRDHAMSWLEAEQPMLLATIELAAARNLGAHAWQLANLLASFLCLRGYRPEWIAIMRTALAAAERSGDVAGQAETLRELGGALLLVGHDEDAQTCLRRALDLSQQLGDRTGQAAAHHYLAISSEPKDEWQEALGHARAALSLYQAAGHRPGQARALNNVGWSLAHLGQYRDALTMCGQAIDVHRDVADRRGEAAAWDSLGYAHTGLGHYAEAVTCYQHALELYDRVGDRLHMANARARVGDAQHAAGNHRAAHDAWQQALDAFGKLGHPDADVIRSRISRLPDDQRRPV
jgi:DNA-binding SARP family transcriptional activator/tetratricopeptide (TPR) repeat protein